MTVAPARLDMRRWAGGGIILSSVATRYQLGLRFQAGSLIAPARASTPHGTWESAMEAAFAGSTSAAKDAANFARYRSRYPSRGGRIGGTDAPGGGSLMSVAADSRVLGSKAALWTIPPTLGSV